MKRGGMMRSGKGTIQVPIGPFGRARAKRLKETFNGLIQHIWVEEHSGRPKGNSTHDPQAWISLIQAESPK